MKCSPFDCVQLNTVTLCFLCNSLISITRFQLNSLLGKRYTEFFRLNCIDSFALRKSISNQFVGFEMFTFLLLSDVQSERNFRNFYGNCQQIDANFDEWKSNNKLYKKMKLINFSTNVNFLWIKAKPIWYFINWYKIISHNFTLSGREHAKLLYNAKCFR